jgi:alpha-tubulin suppressor-like RCC1 family protein
LFEIKDAVHNSGNSHFFFLPPMVPDPSASFTGAPFDASLDVLVEICMWNTMNNACGPSLELYNMETGPGSETVRVPDGEEFYIVNWHAGDILDNEAFALGENEVYRIRVLVGMQELGHADVDGVASGKELKNVDTDEFIPLKDGRTLAIRFRVEEGALTGEAVSVGFYHNCAIAAGGAAYCWGYNIQGQLGLGYVTPYPFSVPTPQAVIGGHSFQSVTTGLWHSCGLTADGTAYCWGYNVQGQLGLGHISLPYGHELTPRPVMGGHTFQALDAGRMHTCGVTTDGVTYCWGYNGAGELGRDHFSYREPTPEPIAGGHTFESVSASTYYHTCGMAAGVAYCWGYNYYGALGLGYFSEYGPYSLPTPQPVTGGHTFASLDAGHAVTCARKDNGTAYCWGYNQEGSLGRGYASWREHTPEPVAGGHTLKSLGAGTHSCGVAADGAAWCWGRNNRGQLGDGTLTNRDTPQLVAGGHVFSYVSTGTYHTCAASFDGQTWCWGYNNYGQVGDGTRVSRWEPVSVFDLSGPPTP